MPSNDESERRARRRKDLPLYRSRVRSRRLLCSMCAELPEAGYRGLPPRVGSISTLGNCGAPKSRRRGCAEVAAHRACAWRASDGASKIAGCRDRAPRIEAAPCDELSDSGELLLLKLMRHNVRAERPTDAVSGALRAHAKQMRTPSRLALYVSRTARAHC